MRARSAKEWAALVEEWQSRGVSAGVIARERGVREGTLRYWKAELQRRRPAESPPIAIAKVVREGTRPRTIRESAQSGGEVAVVIGDARVVVRPGFDAALLREVVSALAVRT